jgi:hypothetical protein
MLAYAGHCTRYMTYSSCIAFPPAWRFTIYYGGEDNEKWHRAVEKFWLTAYPRPGADTRLRVTLHEAPVPRIGRTKGILRSVTPPSVPQPPAAVARSVAQRSLDMPLRIGYDRALRVLRGDGLGTAGFGKLGGYLVLQKP